MRVAGRAERLNAVGAAEDADHPAGTGVGCGLQVERGVSDGGDGRNIVDAEPGHRVVDDGRGWAAGCDLVAGDRQVEQVSPTEPVEEQVDEWPVEATRQRDEDARIA